jgi:integrase/recombinase XerD
VKDVLQSGHHTVLEIRGKGGRERRIPLHPEAVERLMGWIDVASHGDDPEAPLFSAALTARGNGFDGFHRRPLSRRAIQAIVKRFLRETGLNPAATVHSLRVTAITTARDKGVDILALQEFAGHTDPRTTLAHIRSQKRLSQSPVYVLRY